MDVYRSSNSMFLNTDFLVVEYHDTIKFPWFSLLLSIHLIDDLHQLFDLSFISLLNDQAKLKWYIERPYRNILKCFPQKEGVQLSDEDLDELLHDIMRQIPQAYGEMSALPVCEALRHLPIDKDRKFIKHILIHSDRYEETIDNDLMKIDFPKCQYVYGDFKEIMKEHEVTFNSTFILSDIWKLRDLEELGLLRMSSVLMATDYKYNKDDKGNYLVNTERIMEEFAPMHFNEFYVVPR